MATASLISIGGSDSRFAMRSAGKGQATRRHIGMGVATPLIFFLLFCGAITVRLVALMPPGAFVPLGQALRQLLRQG
jgi:hypothetical protein